MSSERWSREHLLRAGFGDQPWYAVRCAFRVLDDRLPRGENAYEERITLWRAESFDEAIALAEQEGHRYVDENDHVEEFAGLAQAYHLFDDPGSGAEVFSLIRRSELDTHEYLARFFDTGQEGMTTGLE
jgi:hypothetical protein